MGPGGRQVMAEESLPSSARVFLDNAAAQGCGFIDSFAFPVSAARALSVCQTPEKSGLPSTVRGAGAARSGLPSALRGMPGVLYFNHCAPAEPGSANTTVPASAAARRGMGKVMLLLLNRKFELQSY